MIKVDIKGTLNLDAYERYISAAKKDFYPAAMKLVVDDIVDGIQSRRDITGGSFPTLEPETIMKKMHDHQLVDQGLLSDPYTYDQVNNWHKDHGTITIKPRTAARVSKGNYRDRRASRGSARDEPRDIVGAILQMEGVKSKSGEKHFMFFGISKDAEADIMSLIDLLVEESMKRL